MGIATTYAIPFYLTLANLHGIAIGKVALALILLAAFPDP
jgi:hypothetical protein